MSNKDQNSRLAVAIDDYKYASNKLSETSRAIGFGLAGVFFSIAFAESAVLTSMMTKNKMAIFLIGFSGSSTILLDYLHYLFGYLTSVEAGTSLGEFNVKGSLYRLHSVFFWMKQVMAFLGTLVLVYVLLAELVSIQVTM